MKTLHNYKSQLLNTDGIVSGQASPSASVLHHIPFMTGEHSVTKASEMPLLKSRYDITESAVNIGNLKLNLDTS